MAASPAMQSEELQRRANPEVWEKRRQLLNELDFARAEYRSALSALEKLEDEHPEIGRISAFYDRP